MNKRLRMAGNVVVACVVVIDLLSISPTQLHCNSLVRAFAYGCCISYNCCTSEWQVRRRRTVSSVCAGSTSGTISGPRSSGKAKKKVYLTSA